LQESKEATPRLTPATDDLGQMLHNIKCLKQMWLSGSVKEMVITNSDTSPLHFQAYIAHFNSRKCTGGQHAAALFSNGEIHMSLCPAAARSSNYQVEKPVGPWNQ